MIFEPPAPVAWWCGLGVPVLIETILVQLIPDLMCSCILELIDSNSAVIEGTIAFFLPGIPCYLKTVVAGVPAWQCAVLYIECGVFLL